MKKIYVGGPFTGQEMRNTHNAVEVGVKLIKLGFAPYIPHLYAFVDYLHPLGYEDCMNLCFEWLPICDALYVIRNSPGTDREIELAKKLNIPIFYNIDDILMHFMVK